MFFKKMRDQIDRLRWKVQSLEEQNNELREDLNRALKILRKHMLSIKKGENISEVAILDGLPYDSITGKELVTYLKENPDAIPLDVRTQQEFNLGFIPGALHVPIDQLHYRTEDLKTYKDRPIIAYCASGARAEVACEVLADNDFQIIKILKGGISQFPDKLEIPESQSSTSIKIEARDLNAEEQEIHRKIKKVLDEEINPAVASHGGVIDLLDVRGRDVFVRMGGGCQGCGMAAQTLRQGVEESLRKAVPHMENLYDVTDHAQGKNPYFAAV